jgi:hypothetical protein
MLLVTSVSLPDEFADLWKKNRSQILRFSARYLRLCMRQPMRRGVARRYNRGEGACVAVTTRFTDEQYDTLHSVAAALRVSVSALIFGLIQLWLKPARRHSTWVVESNYQLWNHCWRPFGAIIEENLMFWRRYPRLTQKFPTQK